MTLFSSSVRSILVKVTFVDGFIPEVQHAVTLTLTFGPLTRVVVAAELVVGEVDDEAFAVGLTDP